MDGQQPGVTEMPQGGTEQSETLVVQSTASVARRTEGDTVEVSPAATLMEQGPVSVLLTPLAAEEAIPMEVSRQEGLTMLGAGEGPS